MSVGVEFSVSAAGPARQRAPLIERLETTPEAADFAIQFSGQHPETPGAQANSEFEQVPSAPTVDQKLRAQPDRTLALPISTDNGENLPNLRPNTFAQKTPVADVEVDRPPLNANAPAAIADQNTVAAPLNAATPRQSKADARRFDADNTISASGAGISPSTGSGIEEAAPRTLREFADPLETASPRLSGAPAGGDTANAERSVNSAPSKSNSLEVSLAVQSTPDFARSDLSLAEPPGAEPGPGVADSTGAASELTAANIVDTLHPSDEQALAAEARRTPVLEVASFKRRSDGVLELRLDPPDLGAVSVRFYEDETGAQRASVSTDHRETLDLLRRNADILHRELTRLGAGEFILDFSHRRDGDDMSAEKQARRVFRLGETPSAFIQAVPRPAPKNINGAVDLIA